MTTPGQAWHQVTPMEGKGWKERDLKPRRGHRERETKSKDARSTVLWMRPHRRGQRTGPGASGSCSAGISRAYQRQLTYRDDVKVNKPALSKSTRPRVETQLVSTDSSSTPTLLSLTPNPVLSLRLHYCLILYYELLQYCHCPAHRTQAWSLHS